MPHWTQDRLGFTSLLPPLIFCVCRKQTLKYRHFNESLVVRCTAIKLLNVEHEGTRKRLVEMIRSWYFHELMITNWHKFNYVFRTEVLWSVWRIILNNTAIFAIVMSTGCWDWWWWVPPVRCLLSLRPRPWHCSCPDTRVTSHTTQCPG